MAAEETQHNIVAIDVGLKNLSLCAMRCPGHGVPSATPPLLSDAKGRLSAMQLLRWEVVPLVGSKGGGGLVERAVAVAAFVRDREALFLQANVVVIEHQMQNTMRTIAASLFSGISLLAGDRVVMASQHSKDKLTWADVQVHSPAAAATLDTYAKRKRAAVECAYFLLGLPPPLSRRQGGGQTTMDWWQDEGSASWAGPLREILSSSAKKDDLADSLLHLCAHECRHNPERGRPRGKPRKRALS